MHFDNYTIRPLSTNDLEKYFAMVERNRKRLEDFFTGTVSKTSTLSETQKFLDEIMQRVKNRSYFPYLIIDNLNNTIAGFLDIKNIDWTVPKAEMGCYIDTEYEHRGITTKAFSVFCSHCFKDHGFMKLYLRTHENNLAARRVAEKCGFQIEGNIRKDYKTTSGELVDLLYYGRIF